MVNGFLLNSQIPKKENNMAYIEQPSTYKEFDVRFNANEKPKVLVTIKSPNGTPVEIYDSKEANSNTIDETYNKKSKYLKMATQRALQYRKEILNIGSDGNLYKKVNKKWYPAGVSGGENLEESDIATVDMSKPREIFKGTPTPTIKKEDVEKEIKDKKYRLPKEYLDAYISMSQGENKNFDYNTYKPTAEGAGNYGASLTAALLKGLGTGLMSGVNKAVTADIGKTQGLKMAKDVGDAYGVNFIGVTPESKAKQDEMRSRMAQYKKLTPEGRVESNIESSIPLKSGGTSQYKNIEGEEMWGGDIAGVRNRGDISKTEKDMYLKNSIDREYLEKYKLAQKELENYRPEIGLTGGEAIESKDEVDRLNKIYNEYQKIVNREQGWENINRQLWLKQKLATISSDLLGSSILGQFLTAESQKTSPTK